MWPPVPPAARTTGRLTARSPRSGRRRVSARNMPHAERERAQRGAAVADERQGHALRRQQAEIDAEIDDRLQRRTERSGRSPRAARSGPPRPRCARSPRSRTKPNRPSSGETGDEAELLGDHREDEVAVGIGQRVFDRALAGAAAEPGGTAARPRARGRPGSDRPSQDRGSGRTAGRRGGRRDRPATEPATPTAAESQHQQPWQAGDEQLHREQARDHQRHADVRLRQQQKQHEGDQQQRGQRVAQGPRARASERRRPPRPAPA